jgi:autotransporter-associated beta strand protein
MMRSTVFTAAVSFLLILSSALSAAETWNGSGAGHPEWSFAINWNGSVIPTTGSALTFPSTAAQKSNTNDLTAGTTLGPISITGVGYLIGGNQVTLDGGLALYGSGSTATVSVPFVLNSAQVFTVDQANSTLTQSGTLSGAGGLTKAGAGTLVLIGNPAITGPVIVSGGTLDVRGIIAQQAQIGNCYLAGSGTVGGIQTLNTPHAAISPGNGGYTAIGTLTSAGNVTLGSTDALFFNLGSNTTDKLVVQGTCSFGGAFLYLNHLAGPTGLTLNADYTIIDNDGTEIVQFGSVLGTWLIFDLATLDGEKYQLSRVDGTRTNSIGNDVTIRRVPATTTSTTLSFTPSTTTAVGVNVSLKAHVLVTAGTATGIPNGTVSFYDGFTYLDEATLDGTGNATLITSALLPGTRNITAVYNGNGSGTRARSQSAIGTHTVSGTVTTTALVITAATGTAVNLTADVDATAGIPTGSVIFSEGATVLGTGTMDGNGVAVFTTTNLIAGTHTFTATYPTTAGFYGSVDSATHTVPGSTATATAVSSSAASVTVGVPVTFTATITGGTTPTGTVSFLDGGAVIGAGAVASNTAIFTTSGLAAGSHSIRATYNGDADDIPSTSLAITQAVTAAPGGGGSSSGSDEGGGGCGLGSGTAALAFGLLLLLRLQLRRE